MELPKGKKAIPNKIVYKVKTLEGKPNYKAHLVGFKSSSNKSSGYIQIQGIDFQEVFAPVVKMTTLRTLFAISANLDLELYQMDVKMAFLQGSLDEELYMLLPEGFLIPRNEHLVCKLRHNLYGLKQAPHLWYKKFDSFMLSNGFNQSTADTSLYMKKGN